MMEKTAPGRNWCFSKKVNGEVRNSLPGRKARKHLVETLILSKISYCDIVFYPLPKFLLARLQRLQFAMASFVTCKYVNSISTILDLGWLSYPILTHRSQGKTVLLQHIHEFRWHPGTRVLRKQTELLMISIF